MDNTVFHNLASIFLGLTAWALPLICLAAPRARAALSCASLSACALALYFQLREVAHRVDMGDLSAVMDTIQAVVFAATVLLAVTLALNAAACTLSAVRSRPGK